MRLGWTIDLHTWSEVMICTSLSLPTTILFFPLEAADTR